MLTSTCFAQIVITFPQSRMVFQRNKSNVANITVSGSYAQDIDRVEVRLTPLQGGTLIDWSVIQNNPTKGFFQGSINVSGGWYLLEIRGILNNQVIATASVDKVGAGEVFVVAGQSNAQGYDNYGNVGAVDDRINCITNYLSAGDNNDPPYPVISQLSTHVTIAPYGKGSWCWGALGDILVQKLNVPILFLNASLEGSSSEGWKNSSDGGLAPNFYSGLAPLAGFPYGNLLKTLQYYCSMLGVRAILWHQGETDTDMGTSAETYKNNIAYVINKTRTNTGKNISWVVSLASYSQSAKSSQAVIDGQTLTTQQVSNVFKGPSTDIIKDRIDVVHFYGVGLTKLAQAWASSLDDTFFNNSTPQTAVQPLIAQLSCDATNNATPVQLTMPQGYKQYSWDTGSTSNVINVNAGSFSGKAKDALGNTLFLSPITLYYPLIPPIPSITAGGPTIFCPENSVTLTSNYNLRNSWNTGAATNSITVNKTDNYSVSYTNQYGCKSTSFPLAIYTLPSPIAKIIATSATSFCSGGQVTLVSEPYVAYKWSDGSTSQSITVNSSGNYSVKVTDNNGCASQVSSNTIAVDAKPLPITPTIQRRTVYTIEEVSTLNGINPEGSFFEWKRDNITLPPTISTVKATIEGVYTVKAGYLYSISNGSNLVCYSNFSSPYTNSYNDTDTGLLLYPNPTIDGTLKVETREDFLSLFVTIYNLKGQLVYSNSINDLTQTETLNLKTLEKGNYILKITGFNFSQTRHLFVN